MVLENVWPSSLRISFSVCSSLPFEDFYYWNVRPFEIVLQLTNALYIFLSFVPICFISGHFYCYIFLFTNFFFLPSLVCGESQAEYLYFSPYSFHVQKFDLIFFLYASHLYLTCSLSYENFHFRFCFDSRNYSLVLWSCCFVFFCLFVCILIYYINLEMELFE